MKVRLIVSLCAIGTAIAVASCSSGLGNNLPDSPTTETATRASTNLPVGLDIGLLPTDPIVGQVSAGVVVPPIGSKPERDIVLLAFTTAANAADGDGLGTALSRDAVVDGNGASDIFVAAICAQDVDPHVFSQSLAGKFRHPRCTTCHSMQAADTTAFVSANAAQGQPHAGPPPGPMFPSNDTSTCVPCHINGTQFPVPGWQAPAASFDLRTKTVAELAVVAQLTPADDPEHFVSDGRVLWALDSGVLPTVGGRNGAADDDHDGIDEPTDTDGVVRSVPGGSAVFIEQFEAWNDIGNVVTAAAAVTDITLISRATGTANAGNGASSQPQVVWVPNGSFTAPGTVGTLFIVYQSDASDLVAGDGNAATDIFRTAINLNADAAGNLDLVVNGNATLVSATNGTSNEGNGGSTMAVIAGATANMVAFQSLATDLVAGFTDANGAGSADVYVRNITANTTQLISHQTANQATGGNGASTVPSIDATGGSIAFESDATDLIAGDTNSVRDVFFANVLGTAPFAKTRASVTSTGNEGTGGISADASIFVSGGGRTLVVFESDKTDLAPTLGATTNVYLFDSSTGLTTLLNQKLSASLTGIGNGSARNPVIDASGANVAFESAADNIDVLRTDSNAATDVFLVDVNLILAGTVLPYRFSLTTVEATDSNGASTEPRFSTFASASSTYGVGFATYTTAATNLGTSDSTNLIVAFLDETSGVITDFTVTPTAGVAPLTVQFTDTSAGVPNSWQWDFDNDGFVDSTEQNPSHIYTTAGTYSVKLSASNGATTNEITKANLVRAIGPTVADFTATPTSGPATLVVQFSDTSTEQPTSWSWDFGDGQVSTQQNPMHSYATPGTYTVALTATNEAGSATETKANFVEVFTPVVAAFSPSVSSGTVPFPVTFTNTSTGAASYLWDFDDNTPTVTTTNPVHTFAASGTFTVTLTATGPGGVDTATTTITANGPVAASFTMEVASSPITSAYAGTTVTFTSTSTGATSFAWDFDNVPATTEATTSVVNRAFTTGVSNTVYAIRLTATGPGGSSIATQNLTIVPTSVTAPPISAAKDTTIYSDVVNNCNPSNPEMAAGRTYNATNVQSYGQRRALIEFDVASNIPVGATILTAQLNLTCTRTPDANARNFTIHRVTTEWGEVNPATGGIIGGGTTGANTVAASNGDATWSSPTFNSPSWTGGSFDATQSSARSIVGLGAYSWASTTKMVSDVQGWMTTANNHGWILIGEESAITMPTARAFASRSNATTSARPSLQISYRPQLP